MKGNKPIKKFSTGLINAKVWKNEYEDESGQFSPYHTVAFERHYVDKNGEWNTTNTLRVSDLPNASLVLKKAYEFLSIS